MQLINIIFAALAVLSSALAAPSPSVNSALGLCKEPHCTGHCSDGFAYDCCATYIRDPCSDHTEIVPIRRSLPEKGCKDSEDFECVCHCANGGGTYLCNVQYFRDPCTDLHTSS